MDSITARTGNAKIKDYGHTSGNQYGQDPRKKNTVRQTPRDERAK